MQTVKDRFRKFEIREEFYKNKSKQGHKEFGTEIFKVRNAQYFQKERIKRYKTQNLMLREIHRALRGLISNAQKERDREELARRGKGNDKYMQVFNDIKNYPDNR